METEKDKFEFAVNNDNGFQIQKPQGSKSEENVNTNQSHKTQRKGSALLFVPKTNESDRRLSIPVVLIGDSNNDNNKFSSNDNVYLENIYKAASMSSLGNFGNIAVEPLPIIKNKDGKW